MLRLRISSLKFWSIVVSWHRILQTSCIGFQVYCCDLERPVMYGALLGLRNKLGADKFPLIGQQLCWFL